MLTFCGLCALCVQSRYLRLARGGAVLERIVSVWGSV